MKRKATAIWNGTIKEGKGNLTTQSGTLKETQYSFKSRFESGTGTNPEELIAAAHAGCFAMQLSAFLGEEGFEPQSLEATGEVTLDDGSITQSHLNLKARVRDIDNDKFQELVNKAKDNCPVSKLLDTKITVDAVLNQ
ncbi:OsmC family protein [Antarcticibacterium flavum]|uniref:OsmC family protein n=1 Tax=Antarcticibacterium flavum TaxID=2058175 RepID=A0A5B7X0J4_9FLAO|nr:MULTISPECIES: OsmC family protein [Antarcticibacterium]MCM4158949.1 OsmC family peroxiredoxin [Antarcticibacterium sp. W02-3]QCY68202.1 OsmC family protein [Antarcticibacterium flavum]